MNETNFTDAQLREIPSISLVHNLGKGYRVLLRAYDKAFLGHPVTTMQYGMLVNINANQPATGRQLSAATGHDPSTVSRTLVGLNRLGLLEVSGGVEGDKRLRFYSLSAAGRRQLLDSVSLGMEVTSSLKEVLGARLWADCLKQLEALQTKLAPGPSPRS